MSPADAHVVIGGPHDLLSSHQDAQEIVWRASAGLPQDTVALCGPLVEVARKPFRLRASRRLAAVAVALTLTGGSGLGAAVSGATAASSPVYPTAPAGVVCPPPPEPPTAPPVCRLRHLLTTPPAPAPVGPPQDAAPAPAPNGPSAAAPPRQAGAAGQPGPASQIAPVAGSGGGRPASSPRHAASLPHDLAPPASSSGQYTQSQSSTTGAVPGQPSSNASHPAQPNEPGAEGPAESHPVPSTTVATSGSALSTIVPAQVGSGNSALSQLSTAFANVDGPPPFLVPIYKQASRRYHIQWQVLAAINLVETNYGRDLSTSSAGAIGWMQFMPETWRQYAVDADGKDKPNPYDPHDAILSAARYLAANGGRRDIRRAVFAYNHAQWYVDDVMLKAQAIKDTSSLLGTAKGYSLPLQAKYMRQLGRTDDGVDIETAPDGAVVYSATPGVVSAVASDPAGFGPNYPVIQSSTGPLAGKYIYYGHVAISVVHAGQHVRAGQPIAIMGHTGDAASLGHGHIEIGFSTGSGDPLSHHGASAWTPYGESMRQFLVTLSRR